ncbi:hypothetical protein JCM15519_14050 [Fundidesulfovibrio butyratiphilus]
MTAIRFRCARCGHCCRASIPLGLEEALHFDDRFLLVLTIGVETWNIDDFAKNRPALPLTHDQLLTTLAFRKASLSRPESRDVVFSVGKLKSTGDRLATFVNVGAAAIGSWSDEGARCPALDENNACTIYENRPLGCETFPLDALFPEMLQNLPLNALAEKIPCGFSPDAPEFWRDGRLTDEAMRDALKRRQNVLAEDSLFLLFHVRRVSEFPGLPSLAQVMTECFRGAHMDLPFAFALAHLVASGRVTPERARLSLARQSAMARTEVDQAMAARDKARRGRTTVLRNTLALTERLLPRLEALASEADRRQDDAPGTGRD